MITVLAGGVGAARFLRGLCRVIAPHSITAVVNTGDDVVMHGLQICPDLDTVVYTLAEAIDPERGWGLEGETWAALGALHRYAAVRPAGSDAAGTWFGLGDQDLATHMYRTARLAEDAPLHQVSAEIGRAWGLGLALLPMTDSRVSTMVDVVGDGEISFQEYFVGRRHAVPVRGVRFDGAETAVAGPGVLAAIADAHAVVIAPSNPIVSIGPIRAIAGIDAALTRRRESVVAISPIVAGAALKGPADRMLTELGHEASVVGVARLYAPVCATLVIDHADADLAAAVEAEGVRCVVTDTIMRDPDVAGQLAKLTIDSASATGGKP
jgi:LPPG:FO 2-phospho-L-lactate transferase